MNIACSGRRLCGCLALALAAMAASGDTLNWTGGANDFKWSSAANWSSDGGHTVPQSGDNVSMTIGNGAEVTNDIAGLSLATLSVTAGSGGMKFRGSAITITGGMTVSAGYEIQWFTPLVWSVAEGGELNVTGTSFWFMNGFTLSGSSDFVVTGGGKISMNCDNSAFTGKMKFTAASCTVYSVLSIGSDSFDFDSNSNTYKLYFKNSGTVDIPVTLRNGNSSSLYVDSGATVTFNKEVHCIGNVRFISNGVTHFKGGLTTASASVVLNGSIYLDGDDDTSDGAGKQMYCDSGTLFLGSKVADTPGYMIAKATLKMQRADCFYDTQYVSLGISYSQSSITETFDLNGFDQTIGQLKSNVKSGDGITRQVTSSTPATLTLKDAGNTFNGHINGAVSLELDAAGKTLTLTGGVSETTGALIVKRGTIAVKGGVSFSNLSLINVGAEGTFKVEADTANSGTLGINIVPGGKLDISSGVTLTVVHAHMGDGYLDAGSYTGVELPGVIVGAGRLVVLADGPIEHEGDAVWVGGTDLSLATAANWKGGSAPRLDKGTYALTFSEGTDSAEAQSAVHAWGLAFATNAPFTLSAASAACTVGLNLGGVLVTNPVDAAEVVHTISAPLVIDAEPQKWSIASGQTLHISGAISGQYRGNIPVTVSGPGTVRLSGDNSALDVPLEFTNGVAVRVESDAALGSPSNTASFRTILPAFSGVRTNWTAIVLYGNTNGKYLEANDSSALVQKGSYESKAGAHVRFRNVTLEGGVRLASGCWYQTHDSRHLRIVGKPLYVSGTGALTFDDAGTVHLAASGNFWKTLTITKTHVSCEAVDALCPTGAINFGMSSQSSYGGRFGTIYLNGLDQTATTFSCNWPVAYDSSGHAYIESEEPAILTLTGSSNASNKKGVVFTGCAGFHFAGSGTFAFTNAVSTTMGPLHVSSGTVEFRAGAGWQSVTNVVVDGTGVLKISVNAGATVFGPAAGKSDCWLEIADSGALEIAAGERPTVLTLGLRGANGHLRYVPGGVYGGPSAGLDAAHTLSFITGTGTILVKRSGHPGTLIVLH